jgi:hypothetical protein
MSKTKFQCYLWAGEGNAFRIQKTVMNDGSGGRFEIGPLEKGDK